MIILRQAPVTKEKGIKKRLLSQTVCWNKSLANYLHDADIAIVLTPSCTI